MARMNKSVGFVFCEIWLLILITTTEVMSSPTVGFHRSNVNGVPTTTTIDVTSVCDQLCTSGLGGLPCGRQCPISKWVHLNVYLTNKGSSSFSTTSVSSSGKPRSELCPTLCNYGLGLPLCKCGETTSAVRSRNQMEEEDWKAVCSVFCVSGVSLDGCPQCDNYLSDRPITPKSLEALTTDAVSSSSPKAVGDVAKDTGVPDWDEGCDILCANDDGGAACDCDLIPLSK